MPEPGYCEVSCIAAFESPSSPDHTKPNTIAVDALLFGIGEHDTNAGPVRIRIFNRDDSTFENEGTLVKTDLRIASYQRGVEKPSETFAEDEYIAMGDAKSYAIIEGADIDPARQYARFTMTGTADTVQPDPPSFTLNIPQYLSVTGKDVKPILHLRCNLANNKMWKDPKALLPHPKSIVSCAGTFSHFEWETRNGRRIARLNINLDTIEFISHSNATSTSTPNKNESRGTVLAKSKYAKKAGSHSPSPKALGKRKALDLEENEASGQPPAKRVSSGTAAA